MWVYDEAWDLYRHAERPEFYVKWNDRLRQCWLINDQETFCTDLVTTGGIYRCLDVAEEIVKNWYAFSGSKESE